MVTDIQLELSIGRKTKHLKKLIENLNSTTNVEMEMKREVENKKIQLEKG